MIVVCDVSGAREVLHGGNAERSVGNAAKVGQGNGKTERLGEIFECNAWRVTEFGKIGASLVDHGAIEQGRDVLDGPARCDAGTCIRIVAEIVGLQQPLDLELVDPKIPERIARRDWVFFLPGRRYVLLDRID